MVNYARNCNGGINGMGTTNHFLIGLKNPINKRELMPGILNCKLDQEPRARDALGLRKKVIITIIIINFLFFCCMGLVSNCLLNAYLQTYRLVQLLPLIRKAFCLNVLSNLNYPQCSTSIVTSRLSYLTMRITSKMCFMRTFKIR